ENPHAAYVTRKTRSVHARLVGGAGIGLTRALLRGGRLGARCAVTPRFRCPDEAREQRVRRRRPALELRMELTPHEVGMIRQLDDLDQAVVGARSTQAQARGAQTFAVVVVELEAMPIPLADLGSTVDRVSS